MSRLLIVAASAIFASLVLTTAASAGSATMTKGSQVVRLLCNNSGCYVNNARVGPGGRSNFLKLRAKYRQRGYK